MAEVEPAEVAALTRGDLGTVVSLVTTLARAYTRGQGFIDGEPNTDIAAVITTASARLSANPEQIPTDVGSVSIRGGFQGWTLAETFVLNRYRRRAQ